MKDYKDQHPGGDNLIGDLLGKSIDEDFEEAEHTKSARKIFLDLPIIGHMKGSAADGKEDLKKGGP